MTTKKFKKSKQFKVELSKKNYDRHRIERERY